MKIIKSYPACNIVRRDLVNGAIEITSEDTLCIEQYGYLGTFRAFDSYVYGINKGCTHEQALAKIEFDLKNWGTPQHSIIANGSRIKSDDYDKSVETWIALSFGDIVKFAGEYFTIEKDFNKNCRLVKI